MLGRVYTDKHTRGFGSQHKGGSWPLGIRPKGGEEGFRAKLRLKMSGEEVQRSLSYFYYFHVSIVSER